MTYPEAITILKNNHFYPGSITKDEKIVGIYVNCVCLERKEIGLPRIKELLGKDFVVTYMPNELVINITKKK